MTSLTPLRVRSHGSLLYGTTSPERLVARALELGYKALALTDRDNLYLAIRFLKHARSEGLRPILGATVAAGGHEALLLPIDRRGYAHLCEILTGRRLGDGFDLIAALTPTDDHAPAAGLEIVVESAGLAATLLAAGVPAARGATSRAGARGATAGLWMGVRGLASERARLGERAAAARSLGLPLVATGDVVLLDPADRDAHRVAVTAAAGELLERMPPSAFCAPDACLVSPAAWEQRVRAIAGGAGLPQVASEALANNALLAERCRLEIELGTPIFPRAPLPDGVAGLDHLRAQCEVGLARRLSHASDTARRQGRARLADELAMIERMGFTEYFLLVAEIVGFARGRGIPSVGRGSGASSIVAYALGITNVDPLRYGLTFERFLNPTRRDCPDLDIDLCWWRRDEVIEHVYDTYGRDRVAMISTHATLGARSAFRETAKALGVSNARVNALARRVPRELKPPFAEQLETLPGSRDVDWSEPPLAQALILAERLDQAPRHLSIHSGGVVIADRPLTHYVPLERAALGLVVTQFEMRAIEAIGLVKMDLLGNRALSTIAECVELARPRHAVGGPTLDVDRIPDPDPATCERLAAGDTLNCFQLESPAMRHLLRMLDARTLDDTIAAVALVRPGPAESGMKEAFCRRARGAEPVTVLHPRLEPVLRGTHGVMLYEEDVLRVAAALTGISLAEGDDLRRAIGAARGDEEFRSLERGFIALAVRAGVVEDDARAVWRDLTRFAGYAFCKAHAAGYGTLGYRSAYLKTHFPTEYAVAILNHHAGMYATWVHVEDLRRAGVVFRAPCAVRSEWNSTLDDAAVRVGLSRVFGLHRATADRIVAARAERPFASLAELVERVHPSLPELESLIYAGALDALGRTRPSLLLEARAGAKAWSRHGTIGARTASRHAPFHAPELVASNGHALRPLPRAPVASPELPEFSVADRVRYECEASGLWFTAHPLDVLAAPEALAGTVPAAEVERHAGRRVTVAGLPCASRPVETKSGERMLFLTLADRSGLVECVLFPDAYRRWATATRAQVVRVEGRVDDTLGALSVGVERAWGFGAGDRRAVEDGSRRHAGHSVR